MIRLPRLPRPLLRGAGTLTATAILAFALIVAVTGAVMTRKAITVSFAEQMQIERAQLTLERMLKIQLDEQNYARAYVITRDPSEIDSYRATSAQFDRERDTLARILRRERLADALGALEDYDMAHMDWHTQVANRMIARPGVAVRELEKRGKTLIDSQSDAANFIETRLAARNREVLDETQARIDSTLYQRMVWLVLFALAAILLNGWRSRLTSALEDERLTTQTLQRAFRSEHVPLPNCRIGSAYGAASSHLAVGGDVFDVHRLSDRLGLVVIADVSGKGVDAAVLTAFIKFTIRGIALRRRDPGFILQEFNRAFPRTVENPYLFVSMFVGILDTWTLRLDYASAGHDIAFLRRGAAVEQLAVTGPVLGVMEEPFDVKTVYLEDGDMIVLSTDGLTEARDNEGAFLETSGAMKWIAEESGDPTQLAPHLIERARARSGNTMRDDVAVLAIAVARPSAIPKRMPSETGTAGESAEAVADA
ncbi:MAG TPA: PP2C family protein-serine/threonine phosphatase [Candidatus Baltobacteraceae bacterium]|nr:PP2C family protein-serine/threonine phosphatase [Candidatus Baltobacteraceae bacterium]